MIDDLQRLPPQALPVIRYLAGRERAGASEITGETGLSDRAFGKAIRALITRRLAEMPSPGVYRLSERGREALAAVEPDGARDQAPESEQGAAPEAATARRLSVLVAQEWVRHLPAKLMVGFDASHDHATGATRRLTLRVQAQGCVVEPPEHVLELPPHRAAGPVQFRLTPHEGRAVRVQIEVFHDAVLLGGLFFEVPVSDLPTARSAQFHALGAPVPLHAQL